jgi:hypothetical protein
MKKNIHKTNFTRKEYREDYLKSPEWAKLRNTILFSKPDCQCCESVQAQDVHHLVYRNWVDVTIADLMPVCRKCHDYIHIAIKDGFIKQIPEQLEHIRVATKTIWANEELKDFLKWAREKHRLSKEELKIIDEDRFTHFAIKRISGLLKKSVQYHNIKEMKFTGRQILQIRKILATTKWRARQKNLKKGTPFKRKHSPEDARAEFRGERKARRKAFKKYVDKLSISGNLKTSSSLEAPNAKK